MKKCDCCIGFYDIAYEGAYFYYKSDIKKDNTLVIFNKKRFSKYNFCPYCGRNLSNIKIIEEE